MTTQQPTDLIPLEGGLNSRKKINTALTEWVNTNFPNDGEDRASACNGLNLFRTSRFDKVSDMAARYRTASTSLCGRVVITAAHYLEKVDPTVRDAGVGRPALPTPGSSGPPALRRAHRLGL